MYKVKLKTGFKSAREMKSKNISTSSFHDISIQDNPENYEYKETKIIIL